jgi:sulfur carrier protein ThiS
MKLHLSGFLPFFSSNRQERIEISLQEPARLSAVLVRLGIPASEVYLTMVNGEPVNLEETIVGDTDEVHLVPPMDGG